MLLTLQQELTELCDMTPSHVGTPTPLPVVDNIQTEGNISEQSAQSRAPEVCQTRSRAHADAPPLIIIEEIKDLIRKHMGSLPH